MKLSLDQWKEWVGQLQVLRTYYDRLTERERYIVLASSAAGTVLLLVLIYSFFAAIVLGLNSKIQKSKDTLKEIQNLRPSFQQSERQVRELEQLIQQTDPNFPLATEIGKIASRYEITPDSLSSGRGMPNDLYREMLVTVSVKKIPLKKLMSFLFDIENSKVLMRITSIKIKPEFQDPTLLNVNFVISTFQPNQPR